MVCDLSATTKRIAVGNKFPLTESAAFEAMGRDRPDAVFVAATPFLTGRRVQLAQLAAFHRLPAIYAQRDYVEVGGLMS
jgi:putative ABC transport system substrate-binding protein